MAGNIVELTDQNFEQEVINSPIPVIVDLWAIWCAPCKLLEPHMEAISQEYAGRVKVGKLDVDHNRNTAARYGIRSIPTLLIFKDGRVVDQIVGAVPKHHIVQRLERVLEA